MFNESSSSLEISRSFLPAAMKKMLIVDDHPENIQLIAEIIQASFPNTRLFQAIRVDIAMELCGWNSFDLIISD